MKMTLEQLLAEEMVQALLGEMYVLTEDRIDDLVDQFNAIRLKELQAQNPDVPPEELQKHPNYTRITRFAIEQWVEIDPSRNRKYLPWIVRQIALGEMNPNEGNEMESVRDDLMTFERLLTIPAYTGPRDIYQIKTVNDLHGLMQEYGDIKSKSAEDRAKKQAGVEVVAREGVYALLKITNAESLTALAWRAYSADNPNWRKPPITPDTVQQDDIGDGKWCVRFPRYANSYLAAGPFYLVMKNGGPYVGIVWERGECQDLDNHGISTSIAEEIYPVVKDILPDEGGSRNVRVFDNIKFLRGDVKNGETVSGPVDLANTNLTNLPSNLTVRGILDLTGCRNFAQIPPGLRVEGTLKISGTSVREIPEDLFIEDMEWSEPLTLPQLKHLFYNMRLPSMEVHYKQHLKDEAEKEAAWTAASKAAAKKGEEPPPHPRIDPATGKKKKKPRSWPVMKARLVKHFQVSKDVNSHVQTVYRYVPAKHDQETPTE